MSISRRAGAGMPSNVTEGLFQRIHKGADDGVARRLKIVVQGLINVARGLFAKDDGLDLHAERWLAMRARSVSK
ncbi:hypothetical protein D3C71_1854070 [compost metagenome]